MTLVDIVIIVVIILISFFGGWILNSLIGKKSLATAKKKAEVIIQDAVSEIENSKKEKIEIIFNFSFEVLTNYY